jgi:hypothetical protein
MGECSYEVEDDSFHVSQVSTLLSSDFDIACECQFVDNKICESPQPVKKHLGARSFSDFLNMSGVTYYCMVGDMFPSFDSMFSLFWIFFVIVAILVIISFILGFRRMLKYGQVENQGFSENPQVVREKEIIREVVKIRCSYCASLYDENLDKCPNCGAKR